jgi:serine/threonine protein kinase
MGDVYRARDSRLGREVAIKVLPPEAMADASRRVRDGEDRFVRDPEDVALLLRTPRRIWERWLDGGAR